MTTRAVTAALLAAALAPGLGLAVASPALASASPQVEVIVRESSDAGAAPERLVEAVGGTVVNQLPVIDGFLARLPNSAIATLRASTGVVAVSPNAPVRLTGSFDGFSPKDDLGSMYWVGQEVTGAGEFWNAGFRGQGVDVALIDSGVAPVDGLTAEGKVLHGPDLSFESQHDAFRHVDTYGHGTHMAGIIAGRDTSTPRPVQKGVENHFVGMAPEARVLSIKVADSHGNTDVSQVIAAIDWVVQHRSDPGLNIRSSTSASAPTVSRTTASTR